MSTSISSLFSPTIPLSSTITNIPTNLLHKVTQFIHTNPKITIVGSITILITGTLGFCIHASFGNPYPPSKYPKAVKNLDTCKVHTVQRLNPTNTTNNNSSVQEICTCTTTLVWSRPHGGFFDSLYIWSHVYAVRGMGKLLQLLVLPKPRYTLLLEPNNKPNTTITEGSILPPVKCIIYYPNNDINYVSTSLYINCHGGGFIGGSPEDDDDFCYRICNETQSIVISVDYKLAPEYSPPTNAMDIVNTVLWAKQYYKTIEHIYIGGFSAGGTVALASATYVNNKHNQLLPSNLQSIIIDGVFAFYPPVNLSEYSINDFLDKNPYGKMIFYHSYLRNISNLDLTSFLISPYYANSTTFPKHTIIVGGGIEPNKGDIDLLADKLSRESTINFIYKLYKFVPHGWDKLPTNILQNYIKNSEYNPSDIKNNNCVKDGLEAKEDAYKLIIDTINRINQKK